VSVLDLVVVGGGITGLGVARLAARSGLSVALFERGDLGSGASSATSHMLHGGLRYLEHGHFALVRESLHERVALLRMAPHLARPTRFLIPFYRGDRRPPWMVGIGLAAYDAFAGPGGLARHSRVRAAEALALEPALERAQLVGGGLYSDSVMDDAGLAVAVARDAAEHGAAIATHTEVIAARPGENGAVEVIARSRIDGGESRVTGRCVVNTTGAWADRTRAMLLRSLHPGSADPDPIMRPTRGVHLVFPALTRGHGLLVFARTDSRVFFVVPFGAHSLVGTTEVEVTSPPPDDAADPGVEELRYLRAELRRVLPGAADAPALALTSGLRPLVAAPGGVSAASREHRIVADGPLLTLAGGKYTTFRVMARDLVGHVFRRFQRRESEIPGDQQPLPRAPASESVEALVDYAVGQAFARRLDDVVRRRSGLWLTPDRGRMVVPALAAAMARRLGWSAERARDELQAFHAGLEREEALLLAARAGHERSER
jgi:glycerol-3-phosphate dehydrogenase